MQDGAALRDRCAEVRERSIGDGGGSTESPSVFGLRVKA
jgi:hypothetical protein